MIVFLSNLINISENNNLAKKAWREYPIKFKNYNRPKKRQKNYNLEKFKNITKHKNLENKNN